MAELLVLAGVKDTIADIKRERAKREFGFLDKRLNSRRCGQDPDALERWSTRWSSPAGSCRWITVETVLKFWSTTGIWKIDSAPMKVINAAHLEQFRGVEPPASAARAISWDREINCRVPRPDSAVTARCRAFGSPSAPREATAYGRSNPPPTRRLLYKVVPCSAGGAFIRNPYNFTFSRYKQPTVQGQFRDHPPGDPNPGFRSGRHVSGRIAPARVHPIVHAGDLPYPVGSEHTPPGAAGTLKIDYLALDENQPVLR